MADVWLTDRECTDDGVLPPVCVRCGADADRTVRKAFSWYPPWVNVLILAGLLPWLVVVLLMTKRMTVYAPVCDEHKNHWLVRGLVSNGAAILGTVALIGLICGGILVADNNRANADFAMYGVVGGIAVFVPLLIVAVVVSKGTIRATEITDEEIRLTGVADAFIDAVEDEREARRKVRRARKRRYEDDDEDEE